MDTLRAAWPSVAPFDGQAPPCDACAHCALPLCRRPVRARVDDTEQSFCCYGCALALLVTRAQGDGGAASAILIRLGLAVFFTMNVMMVSMPTYATYVYATSAATDGPLFHILRVLAMLFTAPVLVLLGWPILATALRGVRAYSLNTDALIVMGTAAAYVLSVINTLGRAGPVYFDTAAMLLVFITLGRYLEAQAKAEAGASIRAALSPAPATAMRVARSADRRALTLRQAQGERANTHDNKPATAQAEPFDCAQDMLVEAEFASSSTLSEETGADRREPVTPDVLRPGDVVQVGPGDAFPTDGVITNGEGSVDEAMLTGESLPVLKQPGAAVASGTCSFDGLFRVRVSRRASESAAARVAALLEEARRERAPVERLADRVASVLTPAVLLIASVAGAYWAQRADLQRGIMVMLAVLVVACPCGLGIATPVALWTGLVSAARHGVIIRSAAVLERVKALTTILFDKTGTLTERRAQLASIEMTTARPVRQREILALAAGLEDGLTHPLAATVAAAARAAGIAPARPVAEVQISPGRGVQGMIAGRRVWVGSRTWAAEMLGERAFVPTTSPQSQKASLNTRFEHRATSTDHRSEPRVRKPLVGDRFPVLGIQSGFTPNLSLVVWDHDGVLGVLRFAERPRPEASPAIDGLRRLGLRVGLLTGDTQADAVVPTLVAADEAVRGLLPADKVAYIRQRRGTGVAMVGDGVNDAPALAAADVGIAVGDASDLTRMTADIAIVGNDLRRVVWLVVHARRVNRIIHQNLFWVFAYNSLAVGIAAVGLLNPLVASLAMLANSIAVVANARRLR